jgi:hypothetical protein
MKAVRAFEIQTSMQAEIKTSKGMGAVRREFFQKLLISLAYVYFISQL